MPSSIVTNGDQYMTSLLWQALPDNLGTRVNFSFVYHPQMVGKSEIVSLAMLDLQKGDEGEVIQHANGRIIFAP